MFFHRRTHCGLITQRRRALTFSDDLLHGDLVPPDSEAPADEICACMTGARAAATSSSSSRSRPRAHQLPTRIKELPHDVEC